MSIEQTRSFLLWCTVINYGILLMWFLIFVLARDWMRRFHGRWFRLSDEQFDALHYVGMSIYKIGILLFNLGAICCSVDRRLKMVALWWPTRKIRLTNTWVRNHGRQRARHAEFRQVGRCPNADSPPEHRAIVCCAVITQG